MIEIERGRVQTYTGNYLQYLEKKQEQEERQAVTAQKLKQMAKRELEWLRRGPKARTSKSKARIDRAHDLIRQSRQASSEIAGKKSIDVGFETLSTGRLGKKILGLQNISKSFGDKTIITDFSYQFKRGDRIGIIGANGSGKTTLLEIIAGRLQPDAGVIDKGETVVIGYDDQENREFDQSMRLIDYIREVAENVVTAGGEVITASQMLDRFLFPPAMQYQTIATLSGGERRRLYLLRVLMSAPNLLLLDEITNDLDIPTLVALEEYLETFPGCLVIVSHDRYFLDRTIDYIMRFEADSDGGFRIREYPGNYTGFLEIREREKNEEKAREQRQVVIVPANEPSTRPSGNRKLSFKEKRELEELERQIAAAETRKAEAEAELAANASDHILVARLYDELQSLNETLDRNLERWSELAEVAG
jgi:ATP-binding cassette subfamily F protein uup